MVRDFRDLLHDRACDGSKSLDRLQWLSHSHGRTRGRMIGWSLSAEIRAAEPRKKNQDREMRTRTLVSIGREERFLAIWCLTKELLGTSAGLMRHRHSVGGPAGQNTKCRLAGHWPLANGPDGVLHCGLTQANTPT